MPTEHQLRLRRKQQWQNWAVGVTCGAEIHSFEPDIRYGDLLAGDAPVCPDLIGPMAMPLRDLDRQEPNYLFARENQMHVWAHALTITYQLVKKGLLS